MQDHYQLSPIGHVRSCFAEKFAIPRQPALAPAAQGRIILHPPYNQAQALAGLEKVSHIWVIFVFHQALNQQHRLQVRPPRLGGNQRIGVFASRASHRPNSIGQSVVRLDAITTDGQLLISGLDLLDGTPVLDIKPYIPFVDSVPSAYNHIAEQPPQLIQIDWTPQAKAQAQQHAQRLAQPLIELIEQCLAQDPKPAYQQPDSTRHYGVCFYDINVTWHYPSADRICVLSVEQNDSISH